MSQQITEDQRPGENLSSPATRATEDVQSHIGIQLRAVYETMIAEPVPERFLKLLEELERSKASEE